MRFARSLFFGCFAMLAAVMFLSMPSSDLDRGPVFSSVSYDLPDFALYDAVSVNAVIAEAESPPKPAVNADAVEFAIQNQPFSSWRLAADAYSLIDPHIRAA